MLVVRPRLEAGPVPPLRRVRGTGPAVQNVVEGHRQGLRREHPRVPRIKTLFEDEQAIPAVLTLLQDTKVGEMVSLAVLRGERGV